ncbi:Cell division protein Sep4a [Trichophyton interdigitale]|uniref:Cell division protein Sep4a n=1 Tax=Trichophyton interdigitale TaxID=101480 RepID=A0A9P4YIM8_9EURO|nr:Cell division protein Sep4a [Trichophyton interdigitale]KAF3896598.1 Cell division protein Sep4a [Trichophyton interdigitale]KAG8209388.1 Cell division protein Sep4a [Trichophyton interdigitale]
MQACLPSRPRTPSDSNGITNTTSNTAGNTAGNNASRPATGPRRPSLGFLRRSKSTEHVTERKSSNKISKKMLREQAREEEARRQREAAAVSKHAPRLPDLSPAPQLNSFGGERMASSPSPSYQHLPHLQQPSMSQSQVRSVMDAPPVPPLPPGARAALSRDPYAASDSMAHRGRYSYASSAVSTINSPRRVRRRKDPTPYNILVVGGKNCGKTSFLEFLRTSLALPPSKRPTKPAEEEEPRPQSPGTPFTSHYLESEIDNERIGLTLWDSEGLQKNIVDLQLREITGFLESKFEDTFAEEMKVVRAPGVRDTHIHCVFLILDPVRLDANIEAAKKAITRGQAKEASQYIGGLDVELDIQVIRTMQGMTTVIPIISKADTITSTHMAFLKKTVRSSLKQAGINPLEVLALDEQEDTASEEFDEHDEDELLKQMEDQDLAAGNDGKEDAVETAGDNAEEAAAAAKQPEEESAVDQIFPLSILSPDPHSLNNKNEKVGRRFPWGFADPYNPEHCDFVKLKDNVFSEWRGDLREASREVWYERWRTTRLNRTTRRRPQQRQHRQQHPYPNSGRMTK